MRVAAHKFAWLPFAAAIVVPASAWVSYARITLAMKPPDNLRADIFWRVEFLDTLYRSLSQFGLFLALGAAIYVLGEIRDLVAPPIEDVTPPDGGR